MRLLFLAAGVFLLGCGGAPIDAAEPPARVDPPAAAPSPSASATAAAPPPAEWTYSGELGPAKWASMSPTYEKCASGVEQTPIDLAKAAPRGAALAPIDLQIKPFHYPFLHNGHTVQALAKSSGATLKVNGKSYDLVQVHIHAPAEHTVDKQTFDGELHFVTADASGATAVVGVFLKKGKENKALAAYFDNLPAVASKEPTKAADWTIDVAALVPPKAPYFTYQGSLTTPPCTEGIAWYVVQKPVEVSEGQLAKFRAAVPGDSNRPLMPLGARKVEQYRP